MANKLYFMSTCEMIKEELGKDKFRYHVSGAEEVVVARDDDWAKKIASKQNSNYPQEKWRISASYSLEELKALLEEKDHAIVKLGGSY